jgi:hypothetical protein
LNVLTRIDSNIVEAYHNQSWQALPSDTSLHNRTEFACRLLEIREFQADGDGELYARQAKEIFLRLEPELDLEHQNVLESAVEMVLLRIRYGKFSLLPLVNG